MSAADDKRKQAEQFIWIAHKRGEITYEEAVNATYSVNDLFWKLFRAEARAKKLRGEMNEFLTEWLPVAEPVKQFVTPAPEPVEKVYVAQKVKPAEAPAHPKGYSPKYANYRETWGKKEATQEVTSA